jgi:hypothetical protein
LRRRQPEPLPLTAEFLLDGLGNLTAAGLLIVGAVMLSGGARNSRNLLAGGVVLAVVEAIYWVPR